MHNKNAPNKASTNSNPSPEVTLFLKFYHELQTPIHGIDGIASFLLDNWQDLNDNNKNEGLKDILKSTQVLKNLVKALMNYYKLGANTTHYLIETKNINEIVKRTIEDVSAFYKHRGDLKFFFFCNKETDIIADIDQFWFQQLLVNLLSNAAKHTYNGAIHIKIESAILKQQLAFKLIVEDEGIGIPEKEQNLIFTPFVQSSLSEKHGLMGNGVGLSICYEIVTAHNGTIAASNSITEKGGARIEALFPLKHTNTE